MSPWPLESVIKLVELLTSAMHISGDVRHTLECLERVAREVFAADSVAALAINPITGRMLTLAPRDSTEPSRALPQPPPDGFYPAALTRQVIAQGLMIIDDMAAHARDAEWLAALREMRAFVALALYTQQRKPLAVIYIHFRQPRQFLARERELLQLFADQAALLAQATWCLHRYWEVARIGQTINHDFATPELLFTSVQRHIATILDTHHAFTLAMYHPETHRVDLLSMEQGRFTVRANQQPEAWVWCRWLLQAQAPRLIRHLSHEIRALPLELADLPETGVLPIESCIFVPLLDRGMPLGALIVQHPEPHTYDDEDVHLLQVLGDQVVLALSNCRLYRHLRQLNATGQRLLQQSDTGQLLQEIVDHVRAATAADLVSLFPYLPLRQCFMLPACTSGTLRVPEYPQAAAINADDIPALALRQPWPVFARDSASLALLLGGMPGTSKGHFIQRERLRSTAVVPLRVRTEPVGVLFINFRQPQRFDPPQKQLIEGVATYVASVIASSTAG